MMRSVKAQHVFGGLVVTNTMQTVYFFVLCTGCCCDL